MRYTYKEFLSFCQDRNNEIRIDGDIVWYKQIPVPESLVKKVFFTAHKLLSSYLDHLISAYALQTYDLHEKTSLTGLAPSSSLVSNNESDLLKVLEISRHVPQFREIEFNCIKR